MLFPFSNTPFSPLVFSRFLSRLHHFYDARVADEARSPLTLCVQLPLLVFRCPLKIWSLASWCVLFLDVVDSHL